MTHRRMFFAFFVVLTLLFTACGDDGDTTANDLEQQTEEAAEDTQEAAQDAWASLRTQAERLVDEVQTQDAPRLKEQLLDRCRDALQRLREAESDRADEVDDLCNRIRETEVSDTGAWNDIRQQIDQLEPTG